MNPEQKLAKLQELVSEYNSIPFVSGELGGMGDEEKKTGGVESG